MPNVAVEVAMTWFFKAIVEGGKGDLMHFTMMSNIKPKRRVTIATKEIKGINT